MEKNKRIIVLSLKIGIGSSLALFLAEIYGLEYAISAGTITLLTLMTSKWGTLELAVCRLASFTMTAILGWMIYSHVENVWLAYGLLLIIMSSLSEVLGWRSTISVNAVISAHLMTGGDFSDMAVWNELQLVLIGIMLAFFLNLFHLNGSHRKHIIAGMHAVESRLQIIVGELAAYLANKEMERNVWDDIRTLEADIQEYKREAYEYQNNTYHSHPAYYISFFEMRYNQCQVLHNLHYEMKKIRSMPEQAAMVADYMLYLTDYIRETNYPAEQIRKLEELAAKAKEAELPKTREEFESRALLYHIVMDLEEFLTYKMRFVKEINEEQARIYWKTDEKGGAGEASPFEYEIGCEK